MTEEKKAPLPAQALTEEERKERRRAYRKAYKKAHPEKVKEQKRRYNDAHREEVRAYNKRYKETHREEVLAGLRLWHDRTEYAHLEEYAPTGDRKQYAHVRPVTSRGFLYLAHDRNTGALKIGGTQRALKVRLKKYREEEGNGITFIKTSGVIADVFTVRATAHALLRGHVRPVTTHDKTKTSTNPRAGWFQPDGRYTFSDVLAVFDAVTSQPERG